MYVKKFVTTMCNNACCMISPEHQCEMLAKYNKVMAEQDRLQQELLSI